MVEVDFYQLTRDPALAVAPMLATRVLAAGERLLIVSGGDPVLDALSEALWGAKPESFLANGRADGDNPDLQPILLSDQCQPLNGARHCLIADGVWRDAALGFARVFFLFAPVAVDGARAAWRTLGSRDDVTLRYWRQDGTRWVKGP